jgi:hypothetical protein
MATLVINVPFEKTTSENKRSFERTIETGIGDEYAIPSAQVSKLASGSRVIVLDKSRCKRAEGTLVELISKSKTNSGMQRYDVRIKDLLAVDYKPEKLGRTGIAVI